MPSNAWADRRSYKYSRDLDRDGHYNVKEVNRGDRYHHGYSGYRYGRPYYGGYYRPYYRPYYGYGYGYGPSVSVRYYGGSSRYYAPRVVERGDSVAVDVQTALARKGYYRGPIDGDIGPMTRAAIRGYQVDRGLAVTGRIDGALIRSLDI